MESMGKVGALDPQRGGWGSNPRPGKIMIMIKVLQAFKGKRQSGWRKNITIKKLHGLVREGKVGFLFCAFSKEKNQK